MPPGGLAQLKLTPHALIAFSPVDTGQNPPCWNFRITQLVLMDPKPRDLVLTCSTASSRDKNWFWDNELNSKLYNSILQISILFMCIMTRYYPQGNKTDLLLMFGMHVLFRPNCAGCTFSWGSSQTGRQRDSCVEDDMHASSIIPGSDIRNFTFQFYQTSHYRY